MRILLLVILIHSLIPVKFQDLADKALLNSTIKVPKDLREDTKYPGDYTFGNAHFKLLTILTSSKTKDIKGYAIEKNYAAIVKRKKFQIPDGFTLLDIKTQEFFIMEKIEVCDEKINIYKVKPIDMFFVFSDIEFKGKTPLLSYKHNYNWDEKRNRPHLNKAGTFSAGAGSFFKASIHAKVRFHSIKKAEISADVSLTGKVGVEVKLQKSKYEKCKYLQVMDDLDVPIPGFGISFRFLGLRFEFGLFFTFGVILKNFEKCLQVDIDYFKGYQFTAKRYISIKRHGTSDSGWKTEFSSIPSGNIVEGSATDLESNYIRGIIQLNQGIKLKAVFASIIETGLSFGLSEPFSIEFGFAPLACPYPYMYGNIELPLNSYYSFSGIKFKIRIFGKKIRYTLLKPRYREHHISQIIKTKKYCLFDSKNNNDYIGTEIDGGDDEEIVDDEDKIVSINAYDLENRLNTNTLISTNFMLSDHNSTTNHEQLLLKRATPFEDITSDKSNFDISIIAMNQSRLRSKVTLNFLYYTGTNVAIKSNDYSFFLKEYTRKDDGFVPVYTYNNKKTEGIGIKLRINYCEYLSVNEMYIPTLRMGVINEDIEFGDKLCVIVKDFDENSTDYVDINATFTTDGTLSNLLSDTTIFSYDDEYFQIQFISITLPSTPDSGTFVHYEICAEWGYDNQNKSLLISNFSDKLIKGKNNISDDFKAKFKLTKNMRLFIVISYTQNYNIVNLRQPIIYDDVQETANKKEINIIVKTETKNKISCECMIERFAPIVRINCSQENSTHRIISYAYTLKSAMPSEYKPQVIKFKEHQIYGVFELKKVDKNVKSVIIHMPQMQPLCNFSKMSDEYYLIQFDNDVLYIPFRRENENGADIIIDTVIQGNLIDEETMYLSKEFYLIDFDKTPIALVLVETINDEYSLTNVNGTTKTLFDYGDGTFKLLALEYWKDKKISVAQSLIIIDDSHPFTEKTIPNFPDIDSVIYHVMCERADEILLIDKTTNITTENNMEKDGSFFKISVKPGHIIDFLPVCTNNLSQPMCFFKQNFSYPDGYAIFRYPDKNGITILNTSLSDLFEQEDRQGLIEEIIKTDKPFYYMTTNSDSIQIIRTYKDKIDLELRVTEVPKKYKKFCLYDPDGFIVPVSRQYYTDDYVNFMDEFGIDTSDSQYLDFSSGNEDSCIYATYASANLSEYNNTEYNDTDNNDTDYGDIDQSRILSGNLLSSDYQFSYNRILSPSTKVSDVANSIKVVYHKDIKYIIPPGDLNYKIYSARKLFDDQWLKNSSKLEYEIADYFLRTKLKYQIHDNNSIYVLYIPYQEFDFTSPLEPDEFISSKGNITINCLSNSLNYFLYEKSHTIIDLGNSNEINLNLIGKGSVEFKTTVGTILKIKGTMSIDLNRTIYVSDNIKEIYFENVNYANDAELHVINSLKQKIVVKIANVTILAHCNSNITDLEITENVLIKQTGTAFFDETTIVNNANMIIDMIAYQNDLNPMVKGSLSKLPKSISIKRSSKDGPKQNDEYIIFDGKFDCNFLIERLKYENSLFNTARCLDYNNTNIQLLDDEINETRAFVSFERQNPTKRIETYWQPELIAMIVLACIAFVLLIVIGITVFIKTRYYSIGNDDSYDL